MTEPRLFRAELVLHDRDLVAQDEDLDGLVPIAHRQQAQHRVLMPEYSSSASMAASAQ
ncbi:hypothetical protein ABZT45_31470 [Streptomyces sp. NPDC005356]|uniref:hypothetical protein n=1 Tax=unclassified Streptomyces TaxID=2593676 RepID=UPI0033B47200